MKYNRCLRCDINYVADGESYCEICKKEMSGKFSDDELNLDENICPYCEKNKLEYDEEICKACKNKRLLKQLKKKSKK